MQPLVEQHLKAINANSALVTGSMALSEYVEIHYMPWVESNEAPLQHVATNKFGIRTSSPDLARLPLLI